MSDERVPVWLKDQVAQRAGDCCEYCRSQARFAMQSFSVEHVEPHSRMGTDAFENLALACQGCNRYKSDLVSAPDPVTGSEVALFHPQQHHWLEHFSWNENATQILGLTPTGRATIAALKMNRQQMIRVRRMWVAMNEHPPDLD